MTKEKYEIIEAEVVFVSTEDVRLLTLDSKSDGNRVEGWRFEQDGE